MISFAVDYWEYTNNTTLYKSARETALNMGVSLKLIMPKRPWYRVIIWKNTEWDYDYKEFRTRKEAIAFIGKSLKSLSEKYPGSFADIQHIRPRDQEPLDIETMVYDGEKVKKAY